MKGLLPLLAWILPGFLLVSLVVYIVLSGRSRIVLRQKVAELLEVQRKLEVANAALAQANAALERLSAIDALTGIANRRRLDEALETAMGRSAREKESLAAAMIDIDHFKPYNDRYGHPAGDECLKRVAILIDSMLERADDLAARYGGEEFLVILPNTDAAGAAVMAERIRKGVEDMGIPHSESRAADHVTVSVGYAAILPLPGMSPAGLVEAADRALYAAKERGRNRVSD